MSSNTLHVIETAISLSDRRKENYPMSPKLNDTELMSRYADDLLCTGAQEDVQRAIEIVRNAPKGLLDTSPGLKILYDALSDSRDSHKQPRGDLGDYRYGFKNIRREVDSSTQ